MNRPTPRGDAGLRELAGTETVFRLVADPLFVPADTHVRLPAHAFTPSSHDEEEAKLRGFPHAFVSVFCVSKTTVSQGIRIRMAKRALTAFAITVDELRGAAAKAGHPPADVLSDPLPAKDGPGRRGHCQIRGLRDPKATPKLRRAFRDELDVVCRPITDDHAPRNIRKMVLDVIDSVLAFAASSTSNNT
jgi:hypothetical protein